MNCIGCNEKIKAEEDAQQIAPSQFLCEVCSNKELDAKPWSEGKEKNELEAPRLRRKAKEPRLIRETKLMSGY